MKVLTSNHCHEIDFVKICDQVTGVPEEWIRQALSNSKKEGVIAGGFKWRIPDEKTVAANVELWKKKASHGQRVSVVHVL